MRIRKFFAECAAALFLAGAASLSVPAADWPQWRGPDHSNVSPETGLLKAWPKEGPPLVWRATGLGLGIHTVSVSGGRVFTTGNIEENEFLFAVDAATGEKLWASQLGRTVQENPLMRWLSQRSPTVDAERLYVFTGNGELTCMRAMDGQRLWKRNYARDFGTRRHAWGYCDRPLIDGERLICTPFGTNGFIAALDKRTGALIWKTVLESPRLAGHASLVATEADGVRQFIAFHARGLAGFAAADGKLLWEYDRPRTRTGISYTPLARGNLVASPNGYGGGLVLIELGRENGEWKVTEVYQNNETFNPFQDSTALVGDHLFTSLQLGLPSCIEFKTGRVIWKEKTSAGAGRLALTYADGCLYLRHENGTVTLAEANPEGYVEKGSFTVADHQPSNGITFPVVANGRLYLRDNDRLYCHDISEGALAAPRAEPRRPAIVLSRSERLPDASSLGEPPESGDRAPDAVFVPTPTDVVAKMMELARLSKEDVLADLGSGDGRVTIAAARLSGCRAIGYEIDPRLVELSRDAVRNERLETLVRIEQEDLFTRDLSQATVVTAYLYPRLMERLIPQLQALKPGSRIISHQFEIPGIEPDEVTVVDSIETGEKHRILKWTTPLKEPSLPGTTVTP